MQQAIFTAHCPYELGDIVEVAIIEGMAITGYPRRLGTAEMQITDIITEHSLKNGTVMDLPKVGFLQGHGERAVDNVGERAYSMFTHANNFRYALINQGFVTDSDTEKELKKWQQARTTAVDEDKLKQQYKNRLNNAQGQHFEREILAGCRMYESHGIATIDKTPEPFRVTSKNHRTGEFTGRFSTHAQPDFQGTLYGGRSIMFEAKRTSKDRITRNVLTDTQMDVLEKHSRLGALCGVCICIQDDFFFIPWNVWRDMKEMYGRQYLKPDDIEEYKVKFDGAVHFLMHTEELKGAYENAERKR